MKVKVDYDIYAKNTIRRTYHAWSLSGDPHETCKIQIESRSSFQDYGFTYLEVRSTLTRKYDELPRVTLPIFSKFSPSALMLTILKTNQYSSEVLFFTWSATMAPSVPKKKIKFVIIKPGNKPH